jgi:hypothetical protein
MGKRILLGLFLLLAQTGAVSAGMVPLFQDSGVLTGPGWDGNTHSFEIPASGVYRATVTDFGFPNPADALGFMVATSSQLLASSSAAGSVRFQADPGMHFLNVFGQPAGAMPVANYGVQVQALPLPPAAVLFAGSLVALVAVGRHLRGQA